MTLRKPNGKDVLARLERIAQDNSTRNVEAAIEKKYSSLTLARAEKRALAILAVAEKKARTLILSKDDLTEIINLGVNHKIERLEQRLMKEIASLRTDPHTSKMRLEVSQLPRICDDMTMMKADMTMMKADLDKHIEEKNDFMRRATPALEYIEGQMRITNDAKASGKVVLWIGGAIICLGSAWLILVRVFTGVHFSLY